LQRPRAADDPEPAEAAAAGIDGEVGAGGVGIVERAVLRVPVWTQSVLASQIASLAGGTPPASVLLIGFASVPSVRSVKLAATCVPSTRM